MISNVLYKLIGKYWLSSEYINIVGYTPKVSVNVNKIFFTQSYTGDCWNLQLVFNKYWS